MKSFYAGKQMYTPLRSDNGFSVSLVQVGVGTIVQNSNRFLEPMCYIGLLVLNIFIFSMICIYIIYG